MNRPRSAFRMREKSAAAMPVRLCAAHGQPVWEPGPLKWWLLAAGSIFYDDAFSKTGQKPRCSLCVKNWSSTQGVD